MDRTIKEWTRDLLSLLQLSGLPSCNVAQRVFDEIDHTECCNKRYSIIIMYNNIIICKWISVRKMYNSDTIYYSVHEFIKINEHGKQYNVYLYTPTIHAYH